MKKTLFAIVSILLVCFMSISSLAFKVDSNSVQAMQSPEQQLSATELQLRAIERFLDENSVAALDMSEGAYYSKTIYPSDYAGKHFEDGELVLDVVTVESSALTRDFAVKLGVKTKVREYSMNQLNITMDEVRNILINSKQYDVTSVGLSSAENRVSVGISDMNDYKVQNIKSLVENSDILLFENETEPVEEVNIVPGNELTTRRVDGNVIRISRFSFGLAAARVLGMNTHHGFVTTGHMNNTAAGQEVFIDVNGIPTQ